jgi:hypothetical protein
MRGMSSRPRITRLLVAALVAVAVAVTVAGAHVAVVAASRPDPAGTARAQVAFLRDALQDGAAERMQGWFPEGYFFLHVLTGLAAASSGAGADVVRAELAALDADAGRAPFPPDAAPPHGAFWTGWSLLLAVELARLHPDAAGTAAVRARAAPLVEALRASPSGFLESYPGQRWPVDTVVAVAALARADRLVGVPGAADVVRAWPERVRPVRDPATGLLPHRLDGGDGPSTVVAEGPRATSSVLIALFEPDIEPALGRRDYRAFVAHFVTRRLGWVGVAEYPDGAPGGGDVDSGPLVLGLSLSASVVAVGTARRAGDEALAADLEREAELFGLPWEWAGKRRYAGGVLPVGDAFLAFARVQRPAGASGPAPSAPRTLWWVWVVVVLTVPVGVGSALAVRRISRRRSGLSAASRSTSRRPTTGSRRPG